LLDQWSRPPSFDPAQALFHLLVSLPFLLLPYLSLSPLLIFTIFSHNPPRLLIPDG
jgi:hypothetical protein